MWGISSPLDAISVAIKTVNFCFLNLFSQGVTFPDDPSQFVEATTLNVPEDYLSIQIALNAAEPGDTVLVQPGTYIENIIWPEIDGIKLISAADSNSTIII